MDNNCPSTAALPTGIVLQLSLPDCPPFIALADVDMCSRFSHPGMISPFDVMTGRVESFWRKQSRHIRKKTCLALVLVEVLLVYLHRSEERLLGLVPRQPRCNVDRVIFVRRHHERFVGDQICFLRKRSLAACADSLRCFSRHSRQ